MLARTLTDAFGCLASTPRRNTESLGLVHRSGEARGLDPAVYRGKLLRSRHRLLGLFVADIVQQKAVFLVEEGGGDLVQSLRNLEHLLHRVGFHRWVVALLELDEPRAIFLDAA